MDNHFRTVARALRPYIGDNYDLLDATDAVLAVAIVPPAAPVYGTQYPAGVLDFIAANMPEVVENMANNSKIYAIKALRGFTGASLRDSKAAVESMAVSNKVTERALGLLREKLSK